MALTSSLQRGLQAEGFVIDVSPDGLDALWRAEETSYGAIILDIMLPGRNGLPCVPNCEIAATGRPSSC
jgi:DNA-binding response OmpR family regulator